ncbi:MAG: DMT family transporter [Clostridiaceae bacterium]|nr:DMT family transporter [Clostridiaceae bacterium]
MEIKKAKTGAYYEGLLLITTLAWSVSFIWTKLVMNTGMSSEMYLFLRYTLAALVLLPFSLKQLKIISKKELKTGFIMGCIFFGGMMLQTAGICRTTPSNSSFITTAYVVFAPFTTWFLMKQKPKKNIYAAVGLCLVGIYILNMRPGEILNLNLGNALTLLSAVGWAFQLTYTSIAGEYMDPVLLSFMSFGFTGLGALSASLMTGSFFTTTMPQFKVSLWPIVFTALISTILANLLQVYAQHNVDANKAAVIYTMEALFATVISILIGLENWNFSIIAGGGLIMAAVMLAQFGGGRTADKGEKENV